jgi:hypothetical protein
MPVFEARIFDPSRKCPRQLGLSRGDDIPRIFGNVPRRKAGVKALDRGTRRAQRGLDTGRASAMLCLSGECHPYLWRYKPILSS